MSAIGTKRTSLVHCTCPLSGVKRTWLLRRTCPLLTQSGHRASLNDPNLNRYDAPEPRGDGNETSRVRHDPRRQPISLLSVRGFLKFPFQHALRDADRENGEEP